MSEPSYPESIEDDLDRHAEQAAPERPDDREAPPTHHEATLVPLDWVLSNWQDGDQYGWEVEFRLLTTGDAERLRELTVQITADGITTPILLGDDGRVWDGHHRLCVAHTLGLNVVPVLLPIVSVPTASLAAVISVTRQHLARMVESFAGEKSMLTGNLNQIGATLGQEPTDALAAVKAAARQEAFVEALGMVRDCTDSLGNVYRVSLVDQLDAAITTGTDDAPLVWKGTRESVAERENTRLTESLRTLQRTTAGLAVQLGQQDSVLNAVRALHAPVDRPRIPECSCGLIICETHRALALVPPAPPREADPVEVLRALAEYRAEYSGPECALQAQTLTQAANIIDGTDKAWGLVPSWRWDDFDARFPSIPIEPDKETTP